MAADSRIGRVVAYHLETLHNDALESTARRRNGSILHARALHANPSCSHGARTRAICDCTDCMIAWIWLH
eukprot:1359532-Lingulodinium_polyedra.AAC.1